MSDYSFTEKWAAIPWLNQDTSQAIAPYVNNTVDIQKIIDEEKRKERTKKFMRGLLTVGLLGGGLIGGAKLLSAAQARQAAQAKKILAKRIGKGVGSLGLLGAAIFGLKHLNTSESPNLETQRIQRIINLVPESERRTMPTGLDEKRQGAWRARENRRLYTEGSRIFNESKMEHINARRSEAMNSHNNALNRFGINPVNSRLQDFLQNPAQRRNNQVGQLINNMPLRGDNEKSPLELLMELPGDISLGPISILRRLLS